MSFSEVRYHFETCHTQFYTCSNCDVNMFQIRRNWSDDAVAVKIIISLMCQIMSVWIISISISAAEVSGFYL